MGFRFRYEALLHYRGHLKEKAEIAFSKAQGRLEQARRQREGLHGQLQEGMEVLKSALKQGMSSIEFKRHTDYHAGLRIRIGAAQEDVKRCESALRERRKQLQEETTRFGVMEKLREKDLDQWKCQEKQREQKRLDEISVLKHGRDFL